MYCAWDSHRGGDPGSGNQISAKTCLSERTGVVPSISKQNLCHVLHCLTASVYRF